MTIAQLIVRILRDAGVTHGFGIPSGNTLPLIEAMRAGGLEFVLTAHEGSAAFAADVMARMTGRPGFCFSTMGPGATNLATGVGCAFLDRSPVIALTCTVPTHQLARRVQMAIDHRGLFRPITKLSCRLAASSAASMLADALSVAQGEPPGPVFLEVPEDVLVASSDGVPASAVPAGLRLPPAPEPHLARVAAAIAGARRPVLVFGASARRLRRPALLRQFAEHHRLPFASTTMAKGLIDEDHPLSIGCIERARRQVQRAFLRSADLVVAVGYDVAEVEYEQWIGNVALASIDVERVDADASVQLACEAVGDLDASLEWLCARLPAASTWKDEEISGHRRDYQSALRTAPGVFTPHHAIDIARRVLPREGVLAFDVGAHTHQIAGQWTAHAPGQFLVTNAWSSMGFGLPAAIAAKLSRPDLPVLCIVGDGGFQMTCGEVAVAARLGLSLPIVVLDDGWLSLIEVKQVKKGLPVYGTQLRPEARREAPSHYFGARAVGAATPEEFEAALVAAFHAPGPTVIEAFVDGRAYRETVFD